MREQTTKIIPFQQRPSFLAAEQLRAQTHQFFPHYSRPIAKFLFSASPECLLGPAAPGARRADFVKENRQGDTTTGRGLALRVEQGYEF
jgi:hypothetical protein